MPVRATAAVPVLLVLLVTVIISVVGSRGLMLAVTTVGWPRTFTVEDWRRHPAERYYMAFDLARRDLLRGKTDAELSDMLGGPSCRDLGRLDWQVEYPSGPDDRLVVYVADGKVTGWSVTTVP